MTLPAVRQVFVIRAPPLFPITMGHPLSSLAAGCSWDTGSGLSTLGLRGSYNLYDLASEAGTIYTCHQIRMVNSWLHGSLERIWNFLSMQTRNS